VGRHRQHQQLHQELYSPTLPRLLCFTTTTIYALETPCKNKGTYYNGLQQKLGNNTEIMQETDY
jgi:hypothetical protein